MYKIIQNDTVIDVVKFPRFIRFLASGIALTNKSCAQGIVGSDEKTIYSFKPVGRKDVKIASIKEITLEEFNMLNNMLSSSKELNVEELTLNEAKRETIRRLSNICKAKITAGFSLVLSDGKKHSFRLTTEDQLNLMSLESQLNAGAKSFIYHATNQPCRVYSREDMSKIIYRFRNYVLYHTTYFNVAKQYVNSLVDTKKINIFTYGTDVSEATDDVFIKQILKNGGNF